MPRPEVWETSARYWLANYGVTFESIPMAYDIFRLTKGTRVVTDSAVPLNSHPNGSRVLPPKGSLLIWGKGKAGTTFQTTGHVAVVVHTGPSFVDIVEQNVYDGHICAGTGAQPCPRRHREWGLPLPTSAPGVRLALPTSARGLGLTGPLPCHICAGTGAQPGPHLPTALQRHRHDTPRGTPRVPQGTPRAPRGTPRVPRGDGTSAQIR